MNKQDMIELQGALSTIATTGKDTITMANCLQFLDQKIAEATMIEQAMQNQMPKEEVVPEPSDLEEE